MKATDVIRRDHKATEELYEQYKKASTERREAMEEKIFKALDAHETMEDTHFYPALEDKFGDHGAFMQMEEEQEELKEELEKLREVKGDRFEEIRQMLERVLAHAKEEEREILARADEFLSAEKLEELGEKMEPMSAVASSEK